MSPTQNFEHILGLKIKKVKSAQMFDLNHHTTSPSLSEHIATSINAVPAWLAVAFIIFLSGLLGIVYNYKNFIVTIMCVEVMYLGAVSSFVFYGTTSRDASSAINGLLVLIFGACESAVGLGLLVAVFRFGFRIDFLAYALIGG